MADKKVLTKKEIEERKERKKVWRSRILSIIIVAILVLIAMGSLIAGLR